MKKNISSIPYPMTNTSAHNRTNNQSRLNRRRKGQGQIPADLFAVVLFFIIILAFYMLFNIERTQRQQNLKTDFAIDQTHRMLLGFIKSDSQGIPVINILINTDPTSDSGRARIRDLFTAQFNSVYGDNWWASIQYPASYSNAKIVPAPLNTYRGPAAIGAIMHTISLIFRGSLTTPPLILDSPVTVTQRIPTPDGDSILITLQTWVVY